MLFTAERILLVLVFAALFALLLSRDARGGPAGEVRERYLNERVQCLSIHSAESRAACLREAGAAQDEARRGKLADTGGDFERNRLARCEYLTEPDRGYCIRRMNGEGTTSGSVSGGGILRELVVPVPAGEGYEKQIRQ